MSAKAPDDNDLKKAGLLPRDALEGLTPMGAPRPNPTRGPFPPGPGATSAASSAAPEDAPADDPRVPRPAPADASAQKPGGAATVTCLADVEARGVDWLWPGRLPAGMLAVLDGPPGLGKSSVVIDLVARLTTGREWPGGADRQAPRSVVLLGHEDSPEHTIRPRLDAARADVSRVHMIEEIGGRSPRFPDDAAEVARVVAAVNAALLIIDPISAYIGAADLHRDNEVRAALVPLVTMAGRTCCTVLLLRHLRKSSGGGALNAGLGSIAITALARASMMLLKDPDDETGEARILTWPKLSVGPQPASLRWRFAPTAQGQPPRIEWDALSCDLTADDILDRQDGSRPQRCGAVDDATDFLRSALADGPIAAADLERRTVDAGHSRAAYKRARLVLGVTSVRRGGVWFAGLPEPRGANPGGKACESLAPLEPLTAQETQETQEAQQKYAGVVESLDPADLAAACDAEAFDVPGDDEEAVGW